MRFQPLSKAEVDEVIKQTKQVSKQWAQTSLYERGEYLYKVAHLLIKYHDELDQFIDERGWERSKKC